MRNIKLVIEYDGTRYNGWQRLGKEEKANTIEHKLKEVLEKMTEEKDIQLACAARTETGVHAYGQVVNFKTNCKLKPYQIKNYLNRYLPMDIAILETEEMPERFSASLNAKSKTFLYRITTGDVPDVFNRKYTYYCFHTPDISLMRTASHAFKGRHDFTNFTSVKKKKSLEKEIFGIDIEEKNEEIRIRITANDFLHNMPRMIAATLLEIGLNKQEPDIIEDLLNPDFPDKAPFALDMKGMFLEKAEY